MSGGGVVSYNDINKLNKKLLIGLKNNLSYSGVPVVFNKDFPTALNQNINDMLYLKKTKEAVSWFMGNDLDSWNSNDSLDMQYTAYTAEDRFGNDGDIEENSDTFYNFFDGMLDSSGNYKNFNDWNIKLNSNVEISSDIENKNNNNTGEGLENDLNSFYGMEFLNYNDLDFFFDYDNDSLNYNILKMPELGEKNKLVGGLIQKDGQGTPDLLNGGDSYKIKNNKYFRKKIDELSSSVSTIKTYRPKVLDSNRNYWNSVWRLHWYGKTHSPNDMDYSPFAKKNIYTKNKVSNIDTSYLNDKFRFRDKLIREFSNGWLWNNSINLDNSYFKHIFSKKYKNNDRIIHPNYSKDLEFKNKRSKIIELNYYADFGLQNLEQAKGLLSGADSQFEDKHKIPWTIPTSNIITNTDEIGNNSWGSDSRNFYIKNKENYPFKFFLNSIENKDNIIHKKKKILSKKLVYKLTVQTNMLILKIIIIDWVLG